MKVSGNCQGTSGVPIFIDEQAKNSGFVVSIGGSGLEVSEANAKIPQQSIEENGTISLAPDSNKVVNALIESGQLLIEIDNDDPIERGENLMNIWDKFEQFFQRKVDLLTNTSIKNPILKKSIDSTKILIYDGQKQEISL